MKFEDTIKSMAFDNTMNFFGFETLEEYHQVKYKKPFMEVAGLLQADLYYTFGLQFEALEEKLYNDMINDAGLLQRLQDEEDRKQNELNYDIFLEESFDFPDYENTLKTMIDRGCRAENRVRENHIKAIQDAMQKGIQIKQEVLQDYPELIEAI